MALDFPANPIDGQVFGSYVWSASVGVWKSREESAAPATVSSVPPTTANSGDIWVDSSDGVSYVYYNDGTSGQWIEMVSSGVPTLEQTMPTASIIQTALQSVPDGWLFCEGQAISRTTYAKLFLAIGTYYGSGDGSTTFNVPNLKGRVPVGRDSSQTEFDVLGEPGGVKSTTLTVSHIPQHTHPIDHDHPAFDTASGGSHKHWISGAAYDDGNMSTSGSSNTQDYGLAADAGSWTLDDPNKNYGRYSSTTGSSHAHTIDVPAFTGTSGTYGTISPTPVSALQPYIVLNYMIKV